MDTNETEQGIIDKHITPVVEADNVPDAAEDAAGTQNTQTPTENNEQPNREPAEPRTTAATPTNAGNKPQEPIQAQGPNGAPASDLTPLISAQRRGLELFTDKAGNIITRNGEIVAKSGAEARLFNRSFTLQEHLSDTTARLRAAEQQISQLASREALNGLPKKLNLSDDDARVALEFRAQYNRDPLGVVRQLIAHTAALGYNLQDILGKEGHNSGVTGINTAAIAQLIDTKIAPLTQQQEAERQNAALMEEMQRVERDLIAQYPEMTIHNDLLTKIAENDPRYGRAKDLRESAQIMVDAYYQLRDWAYRNGFNFNAPIRQQAEQRRAQPATQQQPPQRPAALPNGYRTPSTGTVMPADDVSDDANADWDDIIRGSFRAAGSKNL